MQGAFRLSSVSVGLLVHAIVMLALTTVLAFAAFIAELESNEIGEALEGSDGYVLFALMGILGTFLGGRAAAQLSPDAPMRHALALGLTALAATYYYAAPDLLIETLGLFLLPPVALLGGKLAAAPAVMS